MRIILQLSRTTDYVLCESTARRLPVGAREQCVVIKINALLWSVYLHFFYSCFFAFYIFFLFFLHSFCAHRYIIPLYCIAATNDYTSPLQQKPIQVLNRNMTSRIKFEIRGRSINLARIFQEFWNTKLMRNIIFSSMIYIFYRPWCVANNSFHSLEMK